MAKTILDGAMGTMLQSLGLGIGEQPELFALRKADAVLSVQKDYVNAGSDVLYYNTFGAN
ncbi:MAG: homocysteine S-methyltransferase family protein [Spirochaetales bacterium]|nr:homocysteine S-methyltransferase family protein [Spirochaetales bacterium]